MESQKTIFRRIAKERLKIEAKKGVYVKDREFEKNLIRFIIRKRAKSVLLYLPLKIEANSLGVIKKLRKMRLNIYVPFIEDISFKIVKYRLPVKIGLCGILSCDNSLQIIKKIDMAIVPAIGVDSKFRRIGFGKGMYDRFFASLSYRPTIVFAQRAFCFSRDEIGEAHDSAGDYLILPNKIFVKGNIKNAYNSVNGYGGRSVVRLDRIFRSKKDRLGKISNIYRAVKVKSKSD